MTNILHFIGENRPWIFDGIGVFVLGTILTLILGCFNWWKKRERLTLTAERFLAAHDLKGFVGLVGADSSSVREYRMGVRAAKLTIRCHNPTDTPIVLDKVSLWNADTGQEVGRKDGAPQRIGAHDSVEIDIEVGTTEVPCYDVPTWNGRLEVTTARNKIFRSDRIKFRELVRDASICRVLRDAVLGNSA